MNKTRFTLLALLLCLMATRTLAQTSFGNAQPLNDEWRFHLADDSAARNNDYDDSRWLRVDLPHDWGVSQPMSPDAGSCQGYLHGGIGWYRRHLTPSAADLDGGRRIFIYFEGVYNRSSVYLNGQLLGYRPSGFSSFLYDMTPYLRPGEDNVVAVRVDHSRENDARWYTGSGIYRPVWLVSAPEVHLALWGTAWRLKKLTAATLLYFCSARHCFGECYFIRVFNVKAHRQAMRNACDLNALRLNQTGNIVCGGFTLNIRAGGQNNLIRRFLFDAFHEFANMDIIRTDSIQRGKSAVQYMI